VRFARVLGLWGLLIALTALFVGCGGSDQETTAGAGGAQETVETARFDGVESGELELALEIDDQVKEEEINMRILGSFMDAGGEGLPQLDMAAEAKGPLKGEEIDYFGGLLVSDDRIVLHHEGELYQPDRESFDRITSNFEAAQDGGEGDVTACWDAAEEVEFGEAVRNLSSEGKGTTLDGQPTMVLSADLDVGGAIDALNQMHEDSACGAQLDAAVPLSIPGLEKEKEKIVDEARDARLTLSIGKNDVLREARFHMTLKPREGKKRRGEIEVDFVMRLNRVNEIDELPQPSGSKSFAALAKALGYNPVEALEAGEEDGLVQLLEAFTPPPAGNGS
jgi:hypothetical protein